MAIIVTGDGAANFQTIESNKAELDLVVGRGPGFAMAILTGTMAADLAADSTVFAMRLSPRATVTAHITRVTLSYVTVAQFGTPVTAGRRLNLFRGSGAATSGGTAQTTLMRKDSSNTNISWFTQALDGDVRIATTVALTTTGITFETAGFFTAQLALLGVTQNNRIFTYGADDAQDNPVRLAPGQLLAVKNPDAMGASGTWQLLVEADWYEV